MSEIFVAVLAVTALSLCFNSTRWMAMLGVFILLTAFTIPALIVCGLIALIMLLRRRMGMTWRWW